MKFLLQLFLLSTLCSGLSARQVPLAQYHLENEHPVILTLPGELKEISGIAVDKTGRLFGEEDEYGIVYQLDPATGSIIKKFSIGKGQPIKGDFEDIAIVDNIFYLITSKGKLYEFHEGDDQSSVMFTEYSTGLRHKYNVEGLCYDASTQSLLLTCKYLSRTDNGGNRDIYSFSLKTKTLDETPRFTISVKQLNDKFHVQKFRPTAITKDPESGKIFVLSSHIPAVLELSPAGDIIGCVKLSKKIHQQPEGIAFLPDHTLLVSNEGKKAGLIVRYSLSK